MQYMPETQVSFADIDEDYKAFTEKFKPKKTTDDCYTPQNIYDALVGWCVKEYGIDPAKIVRPFYPGGDFEREEYPDGCIVLDNPPFSLLSKIRAFYTHNGIKYFLFAPSLTCISSAGYDCAIIAGTDITYDNGAVVRTAFVTNLDTETALRTAPDLRKIIKAENEKNTKEQKKELPKFAWPDHLITAARCQFYASHDTEYRVKWSECGFVRKLDMMKDKAIFGGGLLLSEKAATETAVAEKEATEKAAAEKAAAEKVSLSEREWGMARMLGGKP